MEIARSVFKTVKNSVPRHKEVRWLHHRCYIGEHLYIYTYSWPEWDPSPRLRAYRAHALTTELSGRTMRCA